MRYGQSLQTRTADLLRTASLDRAGTDGVQEKPSAPEMLGFREAFSVRDVGVECSNHSTPTSRKARICGLFSFPNFNSGIFAAHHFFVPSGTVTII